MSFHADAGNSQAQLARSFNFRSFLCLLTSFVLILFILFAYSQYAHIVYSVTGAMDSMYYTNLILNEGENSQDAAPTGDPIIHQTPETAKSSQGRTKNFSSEEDILLVSAWLNVGMDPIQGVDQSQGTYWRRIHEYFHGNKTFESTRTEVSLMNRWSGIQHDVNVFCGCLSRIEARNQSGSRVDDKVNTIFERMDHLSHFLSHVYFGFKYADRKCMCTFQGRRQETEEVYLDALLEYPEG